jgi:uncharacterized protein with FMN-binding domain
MKLHFYAVITMAAVIVLFACKPAKLTKEKINVSELKDGTYEGSAKHIDKATVQVKIENKKIKEVKLLKLDATKFGQKAKDSIPLRIVERQTPYVDAVSGATEATNVIINATVAALKKASK